MRYEIGKPFPDSEYFGPEGVYPIFTNDGFDLLVIMSAITDGNIKIFNNGKLEYKSFCLSEIPFLTLTFEKKFELGCYFNIYWMEPLKINAWLQLTLTRAINIYLVEEEQYIIRSIRKLETAANYIEELKQILLKQLTQYATAEQVDDTAFSKMFRTNANEMILKWKTFR